MDDQWSDMWLDMMAEVASDEPSVGSENAIRNDGQNRWVNLDDFSEINGGFPRKQRGQFRCLLSNIEQSRHPRVM